MSQLDHIKERLPDQDRDLRVNLGVIASAIALSPAQAWTVGLAVATATRCRELAQAVKQDAGAYLHPSQLAGAHAAAAIMGMTNVYYRFLHNLGADAPYAHLPARLRMQVLGNPGIPRLDFELACLAASAIGGCPSCMRGHERSVREHGGTVEMVHEAIRIAAVLQGVAVALDAMPESAEIEPASSGEG
jgi:alkyl hydroperoxide reductase subunit D